MTVSEFSKYMIDNMCRATLANAMNIVEKIDKEYSFIEMLSSVQEYVEAKLKSGTMTDVVAYKILDCVCRCRGKYSSEFKYNKGFIFDEFVITLWVAINGSIRSC